MESLARRTALALARHPSPALRFTEAVEAARASGMPVTEGVLLRSLRESPDLFRVLGPWRGPLAPATTGPWLVPLSPDADPLAGAPPCLRRLRTSLVWLGRSLDDRCGPARTRWLARVREEARVREIVA